MSSFIQHILSRHLGSTALVSPRLPGRFEQPGTIANATNVDEGMAESLVRPERRNESGRRAPVTTQGFGEASDSSLIPRSPATSGPQEESTLQPEPLPAAQTFFGTTADQLFTQQPAAYSQDQIESGQGAVHQRSTRSEDDDAAPDVMQNHAGSIQPAASPNPVHPFFDTSFEPQPDLYAPATTIQNKAPLSQEPPMIPGLDSWEQPRQVIRVSIGQIHVRNASPTASPAVKQSSTPARRPALSLEDYLKKRG